MLIKSVVLAGMVVLAGCAGLDDHQQRVGSSFMKIGPSATTNAFTICEVVVADMTKMTTQDDQKIKGILMRSHNIRPSPDGAIYGYSAPYA